MDPISCFVSCIHSDISEKMKEFIEIQVLTIILSSLVDNILLDICLAI